MSSLLEEFKDSFRKKDNGLIQLILINVVFFVVTGTFYVFSELFGLQSYYAWFEQQIHLPAPLSRFITKPWTLVTYFFSHSLSDIFHILFNMLALYWFGRIIQDLIGSRRLISLYVIGGLAGGIIYLLLFNFVPYFIQRTPGLGLIGASGCVYAIVIGAATLSPDYRFYLIFLGPVRIVYIAMFFFFISFLGSVGPNSGGNVAHLGGALFGFIYMRQLKSGTDIGKPVIAFLDFVKKLFSGNKLKVSHKKQGFTSERHTPDQQEIDAILDKISRSGYESLSKEEKEKLFKASQK